ncbi:MAG: hypothetical protein ACI4ED_04340 [Suilimivivens sp.]
MEIEKVKQELTGSLDKILKYAGCEEGLVNDFKVNIAAYRELKDKNSSQEYAVSLRRKLTGLFYKVYEAAFKASLRTGSLPVIIRMLFDFGYVDEELAGMDNAVYLYGLAQSMPTDPERGVYSLYQWLMAIYRGKKETSRNELDMDYREYLHEQKKMGRISKDQEAALLQSNLSRVIFEIQNVFPVVNKLTFGQLSVFCPVFSKHNVFKGLSSQLVTADKVVAEIDKIRSKDFKAFYRGTLFSDQKNNLNEMVEVEVLPDIILMPNVGGRSITWQEIEGKKRTTPARMMCSVFHTEEFAQSMLHMTGEFRWEMCKRDQGGRWNDLSEPSLTSEYYDYVQFYRKNKELSAETKEKIKAQLIKVRNNYKLMFVTDYILWMRYESEGLPRLNKAARNILFTYCPFPKETRKRLETNPLYKQAIEKFTVQNAKKLHRITLLCKKLENSAGGVPEEIDNYRKYLEA